MVNDIIMVIWGLDFTSFGVFRLGFGLYMTTQIKKALAANHSEKEAPMGRYGC